MDLSAPRAGRLYELLTGRKPVRFSCPEPDRVQAWVRRPERVEAHLFVTSLALLLHRVLERKQKAAGDDLSAKAALKALRPRCSDPPPENPTGVW